MTNSNLSYSSKVSGPSEKLIALTSESEESKSSSNSESSESGSSDSGSGSSESGSSKTSEIKKKSDKHKSELFSNSDCYFTESGDDINININYLSTTDQQNSKSIISEIQSIKTTKK